MNEDDKISLVTQSHDVIDESGADARNQLQKSQKQLKLVKIVVIILFFTVLAMFFIFVQRARTTDGNTPGSMEVQLKEEHRRLSDDLQVMKARIAQIQAVLSASNEEVAMLHRKMFKINESPGAALNFTSLSEYVEQCFSKFQTTVSFIHMHSSETYFYQRVEKFLRYLDTDFLKQNDKAKTAFMLAASNYRLPHTNAPLQGALEAWQWKDYERLSNEYDFNLPQLPFCIVVPTLNNARNFRYEYNLQSMVNLDYKNFKVVIVDDASTDGTFELIKLWIEQNRIARDIVVLANEKRMTAVPNIHRAVTQHCAADSIVVLVDGDDELLGRYSLKVFNHVYRKQNADVVYSNHIEIHDNNIFTKIGWSRSYSEDEKRNNQYRDVPQKIAHLRSFKTKLYLKIKEADLQNEEGMWLTSAYDEVICLPILEMSCGRIEYVEEFFYLYNVGIGTNDRVIDGNLQLRVAQYVKYMKPKYQCVND